MHIYIYKLDPLAGRLPQFFWFGRLFQSSIKMTCQGGTSLWSLCGSTWQPRHGILPHSINFRLEHQVVQTDEVAELMDTKVFFFFRNR